MNQSALKAAKEAYIAAGIQPDHADDLGRAFIFCRDWLKSLPVEEQKKCRAWMNEQHLKKVGTAITLTVCLAAFCWLGGEDHRDRLHSEARAQMMMVEGRTVISHHLESQQQPKQRKQSSKLKEGNLL